jgi:hypothetical protein
MSAADLVDGVDQGMDRREMAQRPMEEGALGTTPDLVASRRLTTMT